MKKKVLLIPLALLLAISLVAIGCPAPPEEEPPPPPPPEEEEPPAPVELTVAIFLPEFLPPAMALKNSMDYIVEKSNGKFQYSWYPGGSLVGVGQSYDAVVSGMCDLTLTYFSLEPGRWPLTSVMDLPPYWNTLEGTVNDWQFFKDHMLNPQWTDEWSEVKVLSLAPTDACSIIANKPVRTLDDVKGLGICGIGLTITVVEAWGGTPVDISVDGAYEAIQRGLADGVYASLMGVKVRKWGEVAPYATSVGTNSSPGGVFMNLEKYNALPEDIKELFDEVFPDMMHAWTVDLTNAVIQEGIEYIEALGGEVIILSEEELVPWRVAAIEALNDKWAADMDAEGLPGTEILQERYNFLKTYMPELFLKLGL